MGRWSYARGHNSTVRVADCVLLAAASQERIAEHQRDRLALHVLAGCIFLDARESAHDAEIEIDPAEGTDAEVQARVADNAAISVFQRRLCTRELRFFAILRCPTTLRGKAREGHVALELPRVRRSTTHVS